MVPVTLGEASVVPEVVMLAMPCKMDSVDDLKMEIAALLATEGVNHSKAFLLAMTIGRRDIKASTPMALVVLEVEDRTRKEACEEHLVEVAAPLAELQATAVE